MNTKILMSLVLLSFSVHAEEKLLREFSCTAFSSPDGSPITEPVSHYGVLIQDSSKTSPDSAAGQLYNSQLKFKSPFADITGELSLSLNEDSSNDVQETRDDDPMGRSGWGGTAFYSMPLNDKKEALLFVTKAKAEQQNQSRRDYSFAIIKMIQDDSQPDLDPKQEMLAAGEMSCLLKQ